MASHEELFKGIIRDARATATKILSDARQYARQRIDEKRSEAESRAQQEAMGLFKRAESDAERVERSVLADAKVKARQMVAAAKSEIIDEVFKRVRDKLKEFTRNPEYEAFLKALIVEGSKSIGGGNIEVIFSAGDPARARLKMEALAKEVEVATGTPTTLTVSSSEFHGIGGVVLRRADGKVTVDNSFESLIERKTSDFRLRIARELFGATK